MVAVERFYAFIVCGHLRHIEEKPLCLFIVGGLLGLRKHSTYVKTPVTPFFVARLYMDNSGLPNRTQVLVVGQPANHINTTSKTWKEIGKFRGEGCQVLFSVSL